jgi:hypothetical protein
MKNLELLLNKPQNTVKRLTFYSSKMNVIEAKRQASKIFNKQETKPLEEFNYVTENGTYVFSRRNIISPSGQITFGKWE